MYPIKTGYLTLYDAPGGKERQLTNVSGGVFRRPSKDYIAYAYFEDGCYNIYKYLRDSRQEFSGLPLSYYREAQIKRKARAPAGIGSSEPRQRLMTLNSGR